MSDEPTNRPRRAMPAGKGDQTPRGRRDEAENTSARTPSSGPSASPRTPASNGSGPPPSAGSQDASVANEGGLPPRRGFIPDTDDGPVFEEGPFRAPARSAVTPTTPVPPPAGGASPAGDGSTDSTGGTDDDSAFRRPAGGSQAHQPHRRHSRRSRNDEPTAAPQPSPSQGLPATDRKAAEDDDGSPSGDQLVVDRSPFRHWWTWAVVAVLLGAIVFVAVSRLGGRTPVAGPSASSAGGSTVTPIPQTALMDAADVRKIDEKANWRIDGTVSKVASNATDSISCIVRDTDHPNPVSTWQRVFSTSTKTATAALHRVDGYADDATARKAFKVEAASLAACDSVPTHIVSAASVSGLGDESVSLTIAYQGAKTQYRTVVLARFGREIQAVDAANYDSAIDAQKTGSAMAGAAARSCDLVGGTCPTTVTAKSTVPPVAGDPGWPVTSDFPRITPDQGEWRQTAEANVSSKGTQCEGLTLATAAGPSERKQRTYLLYQDSTAPQGFGVDQLRFSFSDAKGSAAFAKKIGDSIAGCGKSVKTAKISDAKSFSGIGEKNAAIAGRSFIVTQDTGSGQNAIYQVAVASVGDKVVYLLANVSPSYRFSDADWSQLTVRAAQRATQIS
ncbi:hypothetical protein [Acidipropionibacterium virtanenii]|uniref:Uncharacterized protein n=1 Tax=Acidipropionibacterium virtanenii TaxID=2057246 RepID=A0A344USH3_9ACTN|nr:hypothetical protein [Acidipropionibacterium virtanenii]AXE38221.1 hypothetical protein JS278_01038 [Acidipropionibacterium virtanenii]